jgi:aminopeptidase N
VSRGDGPQLDDVERVLTGDLEVEGLTVDTDLRWHLVSCLARAGRVGEAHIAAELARDDTDLGRRHAATARAARPDPEAKADAWKLLLEDHSLSHTMSRQVWGGFALLDQEDVLAPYVEAYFDVLARVWEERSLDWAISFSEAMFPQFGPSQDLLARVDTVILNGEIPVTQ